MDYQPYRPAALPEEATSSKKTYPRTGKWLSREEFHAKLRAEREAEEEKKAGAEGKKTREPPKRNLLEKWVKLKTKEDTEPGGATQAAEEEELNNESDAGETMNEFDPEPVQEEELIPNFLPDGRVVAVDRRTMITREVVYDPSNEALIAYEQKQRELGEDELDRRRNAILSRPRTENPRRLMFDEDLLRLCDMFCPAQKPEIRNVSGLHSRFMFLRHQTLRPSKAKKAACDHILREYFLPYGFGKDAKDPTASFYFGAREGVPFEDRVCLLFSLLLLDKKRPELKPSQFTASGLSSILDLSADPRKPDFAMRKIAESSSSEFHRVMGNYVKWRRGLKRFLTFSDEARLARVCVSFRREFTGPARIGKDLKAARDKTACLSSRFVDELYTAARCCALLSGQWLRRFDAADEGGISKYPFWLRSQVGVEAKLAAEKSDGKLPLYADVMGKGVEEVLKAGGSSELLSLSLRFLEMVPNSWAGNRLVLLKTDIDGVILLRALWATVSGSKDKRLVQKQHLSKRRWLGKSLSLEVESVKNAPHLFLVAHDSGHLWCAAVNLCNGTVQTLPSTRPLSKRKSNPLKDAGQELYAKFKAHRVQLNRDRQLKEKLCVAFKESEELRSHHLSIRRSDRSN